MSTTSNTYPTDDPSLLMLSCKTGIQYFGILLNFVRWSVSTLAFIAISGVVLASSRPATKIVGEQQVVEDTKKVVFIAGTRSHGYGAHEHLAGCKLLARLLEENTDNITTKVYTEGWPNDEDAFEGADAIIMFSDGGPEHMVIPHLESLNKYMERGVGLGVIHYAVVVPAGEAGNYFLRWIGGYFETHWSVNPFWTAQFEKILEHEVTDGVNPFEIYDEWYYHMRFTDQGDGIQPILSALPPASSLKQNDGPYSNNPYVREAVLERKESQPVMWLYERTQMHGRGFGLTGAHYHWEWGHPDFRTATLNAIMWIAGAKVPEGGVTTPYLTLEELEINQDYDQPKNFDRDEIMNQLEEWQAGYTNKKNNHDQSGSRIP